MEFLILKGLVKAKYIGPRPKETEDKVCRKIHSIAKDPWDRDPYRSGALKIWVLYTTRNKSLREKRLKCWHLIFY